MKLYQYKQINLSFLILCPEANRNAVRATATSIRNWYGGNPLTLAPEGNLGELSAFGPVSGGSTITSLINAGMALSSGWVVTVMAGALVPRNLDLRYSLFLESETDVLYSVTDRARWLFHDASLNGIMMRRETWDSVGPFREEGDLALCKVDWAERAISAGIRLKGVTGTKIL